MYFWLRGSTTHCQELVKVQPPSLCWVRLPHHQKSTYRLHGGCIQLTGPPWNERRNSVLTLTESLMQPSYSVVVFKRVLLHLELCGDISLQPRTSSSSSHWLAGSEEMISKDSWMFHLPRSANILMSCKRLAFELKQSILSTNYSS